MRKLAIYWVLFSLIFSAAPAFAAKGKKKTKPDEKIPMSTGIADQMGSLKWGMSPEEVIKLKKKEIEDYFKPLLQKAGGAIEEDNLRTKMLADIRKVSDSYVKFDGQNTGWEVSMLGKEFTHNNGEALIQAKSEKYDEYLFFIENHLWKRFRAFKRDAFKEQLTFPQFVDTLEKYLNKGKHINRVNEMGQEVLGSVEWQDNDTLLRAIDNSSFYGVFCMVFYQKSTLERINSLRSNKSDTRDTPQVEDNSLIDSITSGTAKDDDSNIIDKLTGQTSGKSTQIDQGDSVMGGKSKGSQSSDEDEDKKKDEEKKKSSDDDIFR